MSRQPHIQTLLLSLLLFASGISFGATASLPESNQTEPLPLLYVFPPIGMASVGEIYQIDVMLANVTNLYSLDIQFAWGSRVLDHIDHWYHIPWWDLGDGVLNDPYVILKDEVNEDEGTYRLIATSRPPAEPWSGNGIVFTMQFRVQQYGETDLYFTSTLLVDQTGADIPHQTQDGYFEMPGLGDVPVANFTVSPAMLIINRTDILFNASASYDPDPGGGIALYMWDWGDGTKTETSNPTVTRKYVKPGLGEGGRWYFNVRLSVMDVEGSQSKPVSKTVTLWHPMPVAKFTTWPPPNIKGEVYAVINKDIKFDASESFDPDLEAGNLSGGIDTYEWWWDTWKQGEINITVTSDPITYRNYSYQKPGGFVVTVKVNDTEGLDSSTSLGIRIFVIDSRDVEVTSVQVSQAELLRGLNATINATITNLGNAKETFNATAYYNQTSIGPGTQWQKIEEKNVTSLQYGENTTLTFSWNTRYVAPKSYYYIMVNTTEVPHEMNATNNAKISDAPIYIREAPPFASFDYSPKVPITEEEVVFDASSSYDLDGDITQYIWDFGDGTTKNYKGANLTDTTTHSYNDPGKYNATLTVVDNDGLTHSTKRCIEIAIHYALDVSIDVGTIHFSGEIAEFYTLVLRMGERVNATEITAVLYYSNGTLHQDLSNNKRLVATGLYRIHYSLPTNAPSGTYTLLVEASYLSLRGSAIKSFLVSKTLKGWNALLVDIKDEIATIIIPNLGEIKANLTQIRATLTRIEAKVGVINSTLGEIVVPNLADIRAKLISVQNGLGTINSTLGQIRVKLTSINATLVDIIIDGKGEILARVEYFLGTEGTITAKLEDINAQVVAIDDKMVTIQSDLGVIKATTSGVQATAATSLYVTSVFSIVAAVAAIIILFILRKKPT